MATPAPIDSGKYFAVVLLAVNQYQELMALQDAPMRESRIRALARFMQGAVREMDTVGFFNPGCCSLLLPGAELPAALGIAERLRRTVEERELSVEPGGTAITISLGVACAGDCDDFVLLLQRAENALEQSKRSGGNSAYYHDGERTVPVQSALPERAHNASRVEIP